MSRYTVQFKDSSANTARVNSVEAESAADAIRKAGRDLGCRIDPTDPRDQSFLLEAIPEETQTGAHNMEDPQDTIRSMLHAYNETHARMTAAEEAARTAMQQANHWAACYADARELIEALERELAEARAESN